MSVTHLSEFTLMLGFYLRLIQAPLIVLTLGIAIALLWVQRRTVSTLQRTISSVTRAAGIPSFRHSPQLLDEVARARRYRHQLTVVTIQLSDAAAVALRETSSVAWNPDPVAKGNNSNTALAFPFVACMLRDALRDSDMVTYDSVSDRLIILLLHVGKAQAIGCMQRLKGTVEHRTGLTMHFGAAEFPADGYTIDEIVQKADSAMACPTVVQTKGTGVSQTIVQTSALAELNSKRQHTSPAREAM